MRRLLLSAALLLAAVTADAQSAVSGMLTDSAGTPIPDALVTARAASRTVRTDPSGRFSLELGQASGESWVVIFRVGYRADSVTVASLRESSPMLIVLAATEAAAEVQASADAQRLSTVRVSARADSVAGYTGKMGEFAERFRSQNIPRSAFITRADLERQRNAYVGEILTRQISGLRIKTDKSGRRYIQPALRGRDSLQGNRCFAIQVFIDGVRAAGESFSLDAIRPDELEAIEFYKSVAHTPPQYRGPDAPCGTMLLWTRVSP